MTQTVKVLTGGSMTTGDVFKTSLGLIFGLAADAAVSAALGGLMPAGKGWKHLLRIGGVFILGMMTGEKVEEYVYKVFDDTKAIIKEAKEEKDASEAPEGSGLVLVPADVTK